jgi:hypothetical protein
MRLVAAVSDNLLPLLDHQAEAISTALRAAIETASATLLDELRGQVRAAGLGTGLTGRGYRFPAAHTPRGAAQRSRPQRPPPRLPHP